MVIKGKHVPKQLPHNSAITMIKNVQVIHLHVSYFIFDDELTLQPRFPSH